MSPACPVIKLTAAQVHALQELTSASDDFSADAEEKCYTYDTTEERSAEGTVHRKREGGANGLNMLS